jgi:CBS domain-containing protein
MDAITVMNQHHIGSVVVSEGGAWVGIFTERDVLTRIVAPRRDPDATRVRDVMTPELFTLSEEQALTEAMEAMTQRRCRHVPIITGGELVGMLSIGDVNKALHAHLVHELHELESYIASPYVA